MCNSSSKYWDFGAPIAGILLTLSFAPFDYSALSLPALAFLFCCWRNVPAKRAALRGYWFGLAMFGSGVSWVYISMHDFGGADALGSGLLTALFAAFWALFPALAGYLSVKSLSFNNGLGRVVLTPLIWMLVEYFRGYWVLNGFPWLHIAYAQLQTPLAGYMPVLGAYGAGFIAALTASIVADVFPGYKAGEHKGCILSLRGGIGGRLVSLLMLLIVLWEGGELLRNVAWTHEIGGPIRVSMIQGNIAQDQKWRPENKVNTLLTYKRMTEEHWDSNIVIWPETAIPAYLDQVKEHFLDPLSNDAKRHNTDLIVSVPVQENAPLKKFNAVITLGRQQGIYRKTHLLPFGEYLPLQPLSGFVLDMINIRLGNFTPGALDQPLLKAGGYSFITLICYEDAFGDLSIRGIADAAFLVNVTNDGWFGDSIEPHQHLQIARMRAIETGRFLLRSTNTGATAVVSPKGRILSQAPLFQETALTATISPMAGMTPYARWGDRPVIWGMVILLSAVLGCGRYGRRSFI